MHSHHSADPVGALPDGRLAASQTGRSLLAGGAKVKPKPTLSLPRAVRPEHPDHRAGCLLRLACAGAGSVPREVAQHREGAAHGGDRGKLISYF